MNRRWIFSITIDARSPLCTYSSGIRTDSLDDLRRFAEIIGSEKEVEIPCSIDVNEPEDSPRLKALLTAIEDAYGFKPSPWRIVPKDKRSHYFGVSRARNLSDQDLDGCKYLRLVTVDYQIAEHFRGCDVPNEDGSAEVTVKKPRKNPKQGIGFVSTFIFGMTDAFKETLDTERLTGYSPVRLGGADLWRLGSSIVLPRTRLELVDDDGAKTDPDDWSYKWAAKYWDDAYGPTELAYSREEIDAIGAFDLAYTYERVGIRTLAGRELIVSQRFRRILADRGIKNVVYSTVKLAD